MKQNTMAKKWLRCLALVLVIALAGIGVAMAAEATKAGEDAVQIPAVLGDDLLATDDEAAGDSAEAAEEATPGKPRLGIKVSNMNTSSYVVVKGILPVGAYITVVEEDSLAAEAGLLAGDIVVEVDETAVTNIAQMSAILQAKEAGDTVTLKVFRVEDLESAKVYSDIGEGETIDISIELTLPEKTA